jgi:hypothetical protein
VFQILAQLIELSSPPLNAVSEQLAAAQLGSPGLHVTRQSTRSAEVGGVIACLARRSVINSASHAWL